MSETGRPPEAVNMLYRRLGDTHVFSSTGIKGLVHVGSEDRERGFRDAFAALGEHVSHLCGEPASYRPAESYAEFSRLLAREGSLSGHVIEARLEPRP